jgi:hypothetical protein
MGLSISFYRQGDFIDNNQPSYRRRGALKQTFRSSHEKKERDHSLGAQPLKWKDPTRGIIQKRTVSMFQAMELCHSGKRFSARPAVRRTWRPYRPCSSQIRHNWNILGPLHTPAITWDKSFFGTTFVQFAQDISESTWINFLWVYCGGYQGLPHYWNKR